MAAGSHPFPFRTRSLSPPAPMVLGERSPGRVGRRRISPIEGPHRNRRWGPSSRPASDSGAPQARRYRAGMARPDDDRPEGRPPRRSGGGGGRSGAGRAGGAGSPRPDGGRGRSGGPRRDGARRGRDERRAGGPQGRGGGRPPRRDPKGGTDRPRRPSRPAGGGRSGPSRAGDRGGRPERGDPRGADRKPGRAGSGRAPGSGRRDDRRGGPSRSSGGRTDRADRRWDDQRGAGPGRSAPRPGRAPGRTDRSRIGAVRAVARAAVTGAEPVPAVADRPTGGVTTFDRAPARTVVPRARAPSGGSPSRPVRRAGDGWGGGVPGSCGRRTPAGPPGPGPARDRSGATTVRTRRRSRAVRHRRSEPVRRGRTTRIRRPPTNPGHATRAVTPTQGRTRRPPPQPVRPARPPRRSPRGSATRPPRRSDGAAPRSRLRPVRRSRPALPAPGVVTAAIAPTDGAGWGAWPPARRT